MKRTEHQPGKWVTYPLLAGPGSLPKIPGTYAVYFGDELVYIGSSVDIANRFSEHKFRHGYGKEIITPWEDLPLYTPLSLKVKRSVRRGDWAMWEIRLIHKLKPRHNRQHRGRRPKQ
jgi:hypothetical protein